MNRVSPMLLWAVGLAGLVLFFWFDVTNDPQRFALHVGRPTPWLIHERDNQGFRSEVSFLTFGAGAGILGVLAIAAARRMGTCRPTSTDQSSSDQGNSFLT